MRVSVVRVHVWRLGGGVVANGIAVEPEACFEGAIGKPKSASRAATSLQTAGPLAHSSDVHSAASRARLSAAKMRASTLLLLALLGLLALTSVCAHGGSRPSAGMREKLGKYQARIGPKFLEAKSKEPGVTTLPSGVRYKVMAEGAGKKSPGPNDQCKVHYQGSLISGKVFDSSIKRGQPATFAPSGVIRGWTEILQLMVEGDQWEIYIPSDLAYGAGGQGADIPPNSVLVRPNQTWRMEAYACAWIGAVDRFSAQLACPFGSRGFLCLHSFAFSSPPLLSFRSSRSS